MQSNTLDPRSCHLFSSALTDISTPGTPYHRAVLACIFFASSTFVISTLTQNYSQVDKLWSIVPFLYSWMTIVDPRTKWMAILATLWGLRLTANFHRRGGYSWPIWRGEEDYRWSFIQQGHYLGILKNRLVWAVFNLVFISFYQNFLLLSIVAPSFVAYSMVKDPRCQHEWVDLNLWGLDGLATALFLLSLVVETAADNQQYRFQTEKYRQIREGVERKGDYADGFCQRGLFSIVRKPNYAAEQLIWISYYIFSVAATGGKWWNWSFVGCFLLVILFQGSGRFTEKLTLLKYPEAYAEYQKCVPLYVPLELWRILGANRNDEKKQK